MKPPSAWSAPPQDELSRLIAVLLATEERLDELTGGEIDTVTDATGRSVLLRRPQELLRHGEVAKQAAILNALPAQVAMLDARGDIVSVNHAWREFADANGWRTPGYGVGGHYLKVCEAARGLDAVEARPVADGIRAVLAGSRDRFSIEYPCPSPTEQRWFLLTVTPLGGSPPTGAVAMHLNISERRLGEEALRRFRAAMDRTADGIYLTDRASLRFIDVNATACRMLGYTREEMLALEPGLISGSTRTQMEAIYDALIAGDAGGDVANGQLRRKDGTTFSAELRREAHRFGDNWTIVCVVRDLTERNRSDAELRDSEREQRALAVELDAERSRLVAAQRVAKVGSWETDLATGAVLWSEETHRIHGTDPATFHPTHAAFLEFVHPGDRVAVDAAFVASLDAHATAAIKHRLCLVDGTLKVVEERWIVESDATGAAVRVVGTCQDITADEQVATHLQEYKDRLSLATQAARIGIWEWNLRTNELLWDPQMRELYGVREEDFGGAYAAWAAALHPDDRARAEADFAGAVAAGADLDSEFRIVWPDGEVRDIKAFATLRRDADGQSVQMIGVNWDITERKDSEARVRRLSRVHVLRSSINALITRAADRGELFREVCRIAVEQGGFRMALVVLAEAGSERIRTAASFGKDKSLLHEVEALLADDARGATTLLARAISQGETVVVNDAANDTAVLLRDRYHALGVRSLVVLPLLVEGRAEGALALYSPVIDFFRGEELELLTALADDIAFAVDHIEKAARLRFLAYYDELTGLANRTLFLERTAVHLADAAERGTRLPLLLIDIERFKNINDSLGRGVGDDLLRQVAQWLGSECGDAGRLARVDADRFALLLPEAAGDGDVALALEHVMDGLLACRFRLPSSEIRISAKFGVALFPDDGDDAETLFKHAEAALKRAKADGDRYLFYTRQMTHSVAGKLTLETQLKQAIDNGEFVLHYQPKVSLQTNLLTGCEALIRWNDPRTGALVPPGMFIPVLEETGLIYEVGRWALRQSLADYLRWRDLGLPAVRIAVNVSPLQLRHPGFVAEIQRITTLDPDAARGLELEITESMIMADVKQGTASLQAIRDLGLTIAIDDFGTGYSSLGYLSRLPVNTLKIDRSFIVEMNQTPEGLALVSTMIHLAHSLQLGVVAEGVETQEQANLLRLLKCDQMQGFVFSRPVPVADFESRFLAPPADA